MKCYKCGGFLYESNHCPECGCDVTMYKIIVKKSNEFYNQGLEYARERNLSKAIEYLRMSIKAYKANINARNLLGLIYVEIGEYTLGLTQWIISKSQQEENNLAEYYLDKLQNSRQDLNLMNSTVRKYNKAVGYVEQENYDMAEIQLKKLLNDNPKLVKGHQLLALLMIRKGKMSDARNAIRKALKVDTGDPTTILYMAHVSQEIRSEELELSPTELKAKRHADKKIDEHKPLSGDDVIIPKSSYREYNPTTMAIIQIIIGVIVGAAVIFFIVMPSKTKALRNEYNEQVLQLQNQIESMQNEENETQEEISVDEQANYENLISAAQLYNSQSYTEAREALAKIVSPESMSTQFQDYYNNLTQNLTNSESQSEITEAISLFDSGDYTNCAAKLKEQYDKGVMDENMLYYLSRAYAMLGENENAKTYLDLYMTNFPEGQYYTEVSQLRASFN